VGPGDIDKKRQDERREQTHLEEKSNGVELSQHELDGKRDPVLMDGNTTLQHPRIPADPPPHSADDIDRNTPEWGMLRMCSEVVSICRVRDAMGKGLEPMMGLLL